MADTRQPPAPELTLTSDDAVVTRPPPALPRRRRTWREQRWERRRRRRTFEEVLGWLLVPLILIAGYWAVRAGLNALGTSPTALISGVRAAISGKGG